jgi:trimeric autotransporter adhesin
MRNLIRMIIVLVFCTQLNFNCHAQYVIVNFSPASFALDGHGGLYISNNDTNVYHITVNGGLNDIAGNGTHGFSGDGGKATSAQLLRPGALAVDSDGNLYIADVGNNRVRKVTADGIITTVAGNGGIGFSGDGAKATSAEISRIVGLAVDSKGNLYIGDGGNFRIRKVTPDGVITTVAGNGGKGFSGDGGQATVAKLSPTAIVVDYAGNLYIGDRGSNRVRKVGPDGVITTIAGNGTNGYNGDGGKATSSQLSGPVGVAVDSAGNLYISDEGNVRIRKVNSEGVINTFAGEGKLALCVDGGKLASDPRGGPKELAVDSTGNLYFLCLFPESRIRKINPDGTLASVVSQRSIMGH